MLKCIETGNWRASTLMTGGGVENSFGLSVKSSTRRVADIINSFIGMPFCADKESDNNKKKYKMKNRLLKSGRLTVSNFVS